MAIIVLFLATLTIFGKNCDTKSIKTKNGTKEELLDERILALEKLYSTLDSKIQNLSKSQGADVTKPAMFFAIATRDRFDLKEASTVVFDKVIINVGNHYDQYDGVFVAPRKGIYLFSWTISVETTGYAVVELVVEETVISSTGTTDSNGGYHSASMTAFCRMEENDHAFIRTTNYLSINNFKSKQNIPQTSFLGMYVRNE